MNARTTLSAAAWLLLCSVPLARGSESVTAPAKPERLNNLVSELLVASSISGASNEFSFARPRKGWIFVSAACQGQGTVRVTLDSLPPERALIDRDGDGDQVAEAVRYVAAGEHKIRVDCAGEVRVDKLVVKAIPELDPLRAGLRFGDQILRPLRHGVSRRRTSCRTSPR